MMLCLKVAPAFFLLSLVIGQQQTPSSQVVAQDIEYLDEPELVWQTQTGIILDGNGVFTSRDDKISIVTQANGNLNAFNTFTGKPLWSFTPPDNNGLAISCQSGVTFSDDGLSEFLIYSVVDDPNGVVSFTRVISLSLDGILNWISTPLEGAAAGSPLASFEGRYIYLTHNSNAMSVGHFSVLDSLGASPDTKVFPLYSEFNVTNPFSPPGIFHRPEEGYYDGGQGNTNDVVIWGFAPNPTDARVGTGSSFVFQFPIGYAAPNQAEARQADLGQDDQFQDLVEQTKDDSSRRLYWIILGDSSKDWQAVSAPVLTNMGRSLYWSVTRSQFRGWVGQSGDGSSRFNRGKTNGANFGRGTPRWAPCPNSPALSSSPTTPMIFAGTASTQFVKMNYLMNKDTAVVQNTTSVVRSRAIVSPDDRYVYYSEFTGILHQASTDDLEDSWVVSDMMAIDGEFSLTSDGSMLIIGDVMGNVYAYQVARLPTESPTVSPITFEPTQTPQTQPTPDFGFRPSVDAPFAVPGQPTDKPTRSPIFQSIPTVSVDSTPTISETPENSASSVGRYTSVVFIVVIAALALLV